MVLRHKVFGVRKENRLQNSRIFLRWSVKRMRAVFERKVWGECENGEWNWGETSQGSRASHARIHAFGASRLATSDLETKTTVLQSKKKRKWQNG